MCLILLHYLILPDDVCHIHSQYVLSILTHKRLLVRALCIVEMCVDAWKKMAVDCERELLRYTVCHYYQPANAVVRIRHSLLPLRGVSRADTVIIRRVSAKEEAGIVGVHGCHS